MYWSHRKGICDGAVDDQHAGVGRLSHISTTRGYYVGDVFVNQASTVTSTDVGKSKTNITKSLALRFGQLDVASLVDSEYKNRPDFPATGDAKPVSSIFSAPTYPWRLKTVAFPGFLRAKASGVEAAALVPVDGLPVGFAGQLKNVESASVTVAAAESVSIGWVELDQLLFKDGRLVVGARNEKSSTADATKDRLQRTVGRTKGDVVVSVVSEVFYARSFDVTMHVGRDAAAAVNASLKGGGAISGSNEPAKLITSASAPAAQLPGKPIDNAGGTNGISANEAASNATAKLGANLNNASALVPSAPGVKIGWTTTETGDVGLRRVYDRPIAIGYRGVSYRYDLETGNITKVVNGEVLRSGGSDGLGEETTPNSKEKPKEAE